MEKVLELGDVVRLKTGSCKMVIEYLWDNKLRAQCAWHDLEMHAHSAVFNLTSLMLAP